jgi:hypothetical protein
VQYSGMTTASKKAKSSFRLKVKDSFGSISFIIRDNNKVTYCSGNETPLALSNLAGSKACELRFALQDASSGIAGADAVRKLASYKPQEVVVL